MVRNDKLRSFKLGRGLIARNVDVASPLKLMEGLLQVASGLNEVYDVK